MKCGYGFKMGYGFKGGGSGGLLLKPTSTNWQYYRRKENNASYGTATFNSDNVHMQTTKINATFSSTQVGIMSKFPLDFSQYTKLVVTYLSSTTNADGFSNVVFASTKQLTNIPDVTSNDSTWLDLNLLTSIGATNITIANPTASAKITVEYDITSLAYVGYLYLRTSFTNTGTNTGTGNLYVYDVELK